MFNRSLLPPERVPLINMFKQNDSHAEYGGLTNYNWTIGCNSTVTQLDNGCGERFVDVLQLYSGTDAHVSIDNYYTNQVCLNTSDFSIGFDVQLSPVGVAVPVGYDCMFAIAKRNDSHVYSCDNTNASFNVIIAASLLTTEGSIQIVGYNGTELTASRNVFLNLSFNQTCIGECRWANDLSANLGLYPWENCTIVKPWLLSEGQDNKTVFYEVKDCDGVRTIFNDSIIYRFTQDFTSPTVPIVYDGDYGYDIDWWNGNDTLSAYWWNSSDDISEVRYMYRVMENLACYGGICNFTDAGTGNTVTVNNLTLNEGDNYSFEVIAYAVNGLNSSIASSNGTTIDLTKPDAPKINSSSHPDQSMAYGVNTVLFNFTADDPVSSGVASGIEGFSFVLDQYPGTAPDDIIESRQMMPVKAMANDGTAQLLNSNSSYWPDTFSVFSQLQANFTENDSVRVRVRLAEVLSDYDDLMGVKVYLIDVVDGNSIGLFDMEASAMSDVKTISRDIAYAPDMSSAGIYTFNLKVTKTVDDDLRDIYVVISADSSDTDNRNNLSIAASSSPETSRKSWVCDVSNTCAETTGSLDFAVEVARQDSGDEWNARYAGLADGVYYFHAKAKDRAGNWGDTEHFMVNISAGGIPVRIISPFTGVSFSSPDINVTVEVDSLADVNVTVLYPDGTNATYGPLRFAGQQDFTITLQDGLNEIYAWASNPLNALITYSQHVFAKLGIAPPSSPGQLKVTFASTCSGKLCVDSGAIKSGMATEDPSAVIGGGQIISDTDDYTIKIFATRLGMDDVGVNKDLGEDDFLDRENPRFGFEGDEGSFLVSTEMRPEYAEFIGENKVGPGTYTLVFENLGRTADGKANISVRII